MTAESQTSRNAARPSLRDNRAAAGEWLFIAGCYMVALLAWELLARRSEPGLAPSRIAAAAWSYFPNPEFLRSLGSSLKRVAIGYAIAAVTGIGIGTLFGLNRHLNDTFDPLWSLLRPIAPLAWVPIAVVWFGVNERAAIFVIAFTVFFPVMLSTCQGMSDAAAIYREAALTLGAGPWHLFWEVNLPGALPAILAGLRVGMGLAWAVIVASELVVGFVIQSGLGYLIMKYTTVLYSLPRVTGVIVAIAVLGLLADQLITRLSNRLTPWRAAANRR